jgi:hypothetical protein
MSLPCGLWQKGIIRPVFLDLSDLKTRSLIYTPKDTVFYRASKLFLAHKEFFKIYF